jgi:hypothetical protein
MATLFHQFIKLAAADDHSRQLGRHEKTVEQFDDHWQPSGNLDSFANCSSSLSTKSEVFFLETMPQLHRIV